MWKLILQILCLIDVFDPNLYVSLFAFVKIKVSMRELLIFYLVNVEFVKKNDRKKRKNEKKTTAIKNILSCFFECVLTSE